MFIYSQVPFDKWSLQVEVRVKGAVDPVSGMVINIADLKQSMAEVNEKLDHKFIDKDVPWFQDRVSTVTANELKKSFFSKIFILATKVSVSKQ